MLFVPTVKRHITNCKKRPLCKFRLGISILKFIIVFLYCFGRRVTELFSEPPWKSGNENPYTGIRWCWENNNTLQVKNWY
jgi:hypothetical protein